MNRLHTGRYVYSSDTERSPRRRKSLTKSRPSSTTTTSLEDSRRKLTDIEVISHGIWLIYFMRAMYLADVDASLEMKIHYFEWLEIDAKSFPCAVCKGHFTDELAKIRRDRLNYYTRSGSHMFNVDGRMIDAGMFVMLFEFKNIVNTRLGKPLAELHQMFNMYWDIYRNGCTERYCTA